MYTQGDNRNRSWNPGQNRGAANFQDTRDQINAAPTVTAEYVEEAERVIKGMRSIKFQQQLTTSQLRNLLSLSADIYNQVERLKEDSLPVELREKIDYLRIRMIYESGRTDSVKWMVDKARLIEKLKNVKGSRKEFIKFNRYMEALVAYHRFYGGRDK